MERLIGRFGGQHPGALVVVFAAVHGNEIAGVHALQEVFALLEAEAKSKTTFRFEGTLLGILGNKQALEAGKRFIHRDLNRIWEPAEIERILHTRPEAREAEDREAAEILSLVRETIQQNNPDALILLDLHTTSADGGVFCIPAGDPASLRLAKALQAPVILGLMDGIRGTLLHYAANRAFCEKDRPAHCVAAAFEGGRHEDPRSVSRCIAAVINALHAAGCVKPQEMNTRHQEILLNYSQKLPKVSRLHYVHSIRPEDRFRMRPGYLNFQAIRAGEHLADDAHGPVLAPRDGLVLMPLYQAQGSDGFFVVEEIAASS
jgi:succinylglutamate desuccinylase